MNSEAFERELDVAVDLFYEGYTEEQGREFGIIPEPFEDLNDYEQAGIRAGVRSLLIGLRNRGEFNTEPTFKRRAA